MTRKNFRIAHVLIVIGLLISSGVGVLYNTIRFDIEATNVYGDVVTLFGRGIYAYESAFQGPIFVGTDLVIFVLAMFYILIVFTFKRSLFKALIISGFLTVFLYYTASLAFGTMMNRLFLVYIATFGLVLFTFIDHLLKLDYQHLKESLADKTLPKGLKVLLIIMAVSVSVWFFELAELIIENRPSSLIGIKSTEPTYIFDLAIIAPACFIAVYQLKRNHPFGVVLSVMLLSLLVAIGGIVISQTLVQSYFGVEVALLEMVLFVFSFAALSGVALLYLVLLLNTCLRNT